MIENFLTIPDAPDYEINSQLIVRNKRTGRILKLYRPAGKKNFRATVFNGEHQIKRTAKTFRRQAEIAAEDSLRSDDYWQLVPSLGNLYELSIKGELRNVVTKHALKLVDDKAKHFCGYSINTKSICTSATLKSLMWEVYGIEFEPPHCIPVGVVIKKNGLGKKFDSLADCARFLAKELVIQFCSAYRYLRYRPAVYAGYQITYLTCSDIWTEEKSKTRTQLLRGGKKC